MDDRPILDNIPWICCLYNGSSKSCENQRNSHFLAPNELGSSSETESKRGFVLGGSRQVWQAHANSSFRWNELKVPPRGFYFAAQVGYTCLAAYCSSILLAPQLSSHDMRHLKRCIARSERYEACIGNNCIICEQLRRRGDAIQWGWYGRHHKDAKHVVIQILPCSRNVKMLPGTYLNTARLLSSMRCCLCSSETYLTLSTQGRLEEMWAELWDGSLSDLGVPS